MSQPRKPHPLGLGQIIGEWPDGTAVVMMPTTGMAVYMVITGDGEILAPDGGVRPLADAFIHCDTLDFGSEADAVIAVETRRNAHPENR